jgi:hypothetical protein
MYDWLQYTAIRLGSPRSVTFLLTLLFILLSLAGCGDVIPACPSGSTSGGGCGVG